LSRAFSDFDGSPLRGKQVRDLILNASRIGTGADGKGRLVSPSVIVITYSSGIRLGELQ